MTAEMRDTVAVIMGGGAGTRLFPLTKERAKPAVPLAGKYRLVDIPISNCINSGLRRMFVLTQFNSTSLHRHIQQTYRFDAFLGGFVQILAAQQTLGNERWYQGTADAVRQNVRTISHWNAEHTLVLSGDQLFRMDFRALAAAHRANDAEITVAVHPVDRAAASSLGLVKIDGEGRIRGFAEKPKDPEVIEGLRAARPVLESAGAPDGAEWLASMGIYLFNSEVLRDALDNEEPDFGRDILPAATKRHRVFAHLFNGYWEDIGTIRSFYEANLRLARYDTPFDFYRDDAPIFSRPRSLPATRVQHACAHDSIIAEGCLIEGVDLRRSVVGIRSVIGKGTRISESVVLGNDYYEPPGEWIADKTLPPMGIGDNCTIERAIIDKNVRIGHDAIVSPDGLSDPYDGDNCYVRDGIVIVPKLAVIPPGERAR